MDDVAEHRIDHDAQAAVLALDEVCENAAVALERCGQLVNEGRLDGNVVMLKINELAARLMGVGT